MIKLIATDMDGTLLDRDGNIPNDFVQVLKQLDEKKIKFVIASGRPYTNLRNIFESKVNNLQYICDNGAFVVDNKNTSIIDTIDKETVKEIIKESIDIPDIELILCAEKGAYHRYCDEKFMNEINKYYVDKIEIENLLNVEDDIFKISICDLNNPISNSYTVLGPKFEEELNVVVSGKEWVDIMSKRVNKGVALEKIQKDLNISYEETMVFGDFYNDIEMLQKAYYSFVMENANEEMKQYGNFVAKSNHQNGVMEAIKEYVLK
ncbi:MAG: HAD family hydrolase [Romboutsia sp.]